MRFFSLLIVLGLYAVNAQEVSYIDHKEQKKVFVKLEKKDGDTQAYKNARGDTVRVSRQILVSFEESFTSSKAFLEKYHIVLIQKLDEKTYLFNIGEEENIFDIVTDLNADKNVKYAQPNFIREMKRR